MYVICILCAWYIVRVRQMVAVLINHHRGRRSNNDDDDTIVIIVVRKRGLWGSRTSETFLHMHRLS